MKMIFFSIFLLYYVFPISIYLSFVSSPTHIPHTTHTNEIMLNTYYNFIYFPFIHFDNAKRDELTMMRFLADDTPDGKYLCLLCGIPWVISHPPVMLHYPVSKTRLAHSQPHKQIAATSSLNSRTEQSRGGQGKEI